MKRSNSGVNTSGSLAIEYLNHSPLSIVGRTKGEAAVVRLIEVVMAKTVGVIEASDEVDQFLCFHY
jgi:hypothetical protein